jgi:hypothetical protein
MEFRRRTRQRLACGPSVSGRLNLNPLACPSPKASRRQVVDLSALIRRQSQLDAHPPAQPVPAPPGPLRLPAPPRPREPRLAPAARRLQEDAQAAKATSGRPALLGCPIRLWAEWRQDTVLRWHRRRFRDYWTKLSRRPQVGRPSTNAEIIALVRKMAAANPLWGAPRIHGELRKLGIEVAERTVSRLILSRSKTRSKA